MIAARIRELFSGGHVDRIATIDTIATRTQSECSIRVTDKVRLGLVLEIGLVLGIAMVLGLAHTFCHTSSPQKPVFYP